VAHTTLAKRVVDAEEAFGAIAFVRGPKGYVLTDAGREIKAYAERMELEAAGARLAVQEHDQRPSGRVVVSVMGPILIRVLAAGFADFRNRFPDLKVEFKTSYQLVDLRAQKADVVVRFQNHPDDYLVGRRVVTQYAAPYAIPDVLAAAQSRSAPVPVIGWGAKKDVEQRARRHGISDIDIVCTVAELEAQRALILGGAGVGIVPCYLFGNEESRLRWPGTSPLPINDGWVLTHPDLAGSTRVKLVADFCYNALKAARGQFLGKV